MNNQAKCNPTPGPWYVSGTGNHQAIIIVEATGENVAVAYDGEANAHLIAAAPEMSRTLKNLIYVTALYTHSDDMPPALSAAIADAAAAIAKAEGEA